MYLDPTAHKEQSPKDHENYTYLLNVVLILTVSEQKKGDGIYIVFFPNVPLKNSE